MLSQSTEVPDHLLSKKKKKNGNLKLNIELDVNIDSQTSSQYYHNQIIVCNPFYLFSQAKIFPC